MANENFAKNIEVRSNVLTGMGRILDKPRCRVIQQNGQTIATGTQVKVIFDLSTVANLDTDGMWSIAQPTRVTIVTSGFYSVWGYVRWATGSAGFQRDAWIAKNNVAFKYSPDFITFPSASVSSTCVMSTGMQLNAGDYLEVLVFHDFGSNLTLSTGGGDSVAAELIACLIST